MKTKFLLPLCISVVMGAMVFISCEHEQNYSESIQNEEVNQFLQSSYGKDFLENFHFQIEDLNVEKLASLSQKNDVKLLCIPVTKNEKELGRLCVISNSHGRIFQALYEDWSEVNTEEMCIRDRYSASFPVTGTFDNPAGLAACLAICFPAALYFMASRPVGAKVWGGLSAVSYTHLRQSEIYRRGFTGTFQW